MSDEYSQISDDVDEQMDSSSFILNHQDLKHIKYNTSLSLRGIKSGIIDNLSNSMNDSDLSVETSHYWTGNDDDSDNNCYKKNNESICNRQISRNTIDSGDSHNEEIENMNEQLKMYKKRVEYISKTNDQLRCDLIKTIKTNVLLEQYLVCPYIMNDMGEITFPGKNDLDKQFDVMFKELEEIKKDTMIFLNDKLLVEKLQIVLNSPLPKCLNNCYINVNDK